MRKQSVCIVVMVMLLASMFIAVNVKADVTGTSLAQNEEIAIPLNVRNYTMVNGWSSMVVGLTNDFKNAPFAGRDLTGNIVLASGSLQLGLYANKKQVSDEQVFSSMSSGIAWVRLVYIGQTMTGSWVIQLNIAENPETLFTGSAISVEVPIMFTGGSQIVVVSQPSIITPQLVFAVAIIVLSFMLVVYQARKKTKV